MAAKIEIKEVSCERPLFCDDYQTARLLGILDNRSDSARPSWKLTC